MGHFIRRGDTWIPSTDADNVADNLPASVFMLEYNPMIGWYFSPSLDLNVPERVYGECNSYVDRVFGTFMDRSGCTGALLVGEKGSGKTMLAKMIAKLALKNGFPVILLASPIDTISLTNILTAMTQPAVFLIDEFEKVFGGANSSPEDGDENKGSPSQQQLLTVMDGVVSSKKLFLLTCNDEWRIDSHLLNRPGRLFYRINYAGVSKDAIIEYCKENLKDQSHLDGVLEVAGLFPGSEFNFDLLKSIVEEMNRYKETAFQAIKYMNAVPPERGHSYELELEWKGKKIPREDYMFQSIINRLPMRTFGHDNLLKFGLPTGSDSNAKSSIVSIVIGPNCLAKTDSKAGIYVYKGKDFVLTCTRSLPKMDGYQEYMAGRYGAAF